jgi:hypothetical protein
VQLRYCGESRALGLAASAYAEGARNEDSRFETNTILVRSNISNLPACRMAVHGSSAIEQSDQNLLVDGLCQKVRDPIPTRLAVIAYTWGAKAVACTQPS